MSHIQRICFVNSFLYNVYHPETRGTFGGAEIQLFTIIEELRSDFDYDIVVFGSNQTQTLRQKKNSITFWNVRAVWPWFLFNFINILRFFLNLYKINADVYIIRAASAQVGAVAIFCNIFKKQCIYMIASMIDVDGRYMESDTWLSGKSFLYGLRHSTIIAQNQEQVDLLQKNYGISSQLMHNGIQVPAVTPEILEKNCILWVGRADSNKQPMTFIDLARHFPNEQFVLIISLKDTQLIENIRLTAKKLSNVTVYENMPFLETEQFYKRAKVLVNTSVYEGFPNTFLHAGAYYCPSLSLNVNPDNIFFSHKIGWHTNGDVEKLQTFLTKALSNETFRLEYGKAARHYVETHHDMKKNIQVFQRAIYSQAI